MTKSRRNVRFPHRNGERRLSVSSDVSDATSEPSSPSKNGAASKQTTIPEDVRLSTVGVIFDDYV
jgi:phosphatidate cytidylyltransferase